MDVDTDDNINKVYKIVWNRRAKGDIPVTVVAYYIRLCYSFGDISSGNVHYVFRHKILQDIFVLDEINRKTIESINEGNKYDS